MPAPIATSRSSSTKRPKRKSLTVYLLGVFACKFCDQRLDDLDRAVERQPHRFREICDEFVVERQARGRLAADHERARRLSAERLDEREHVHGIHSVPVDRGRLSVDLWL